MLISLLPTTSHLVASLTMVTLSLALALYFVFVHPHFIFPATSLSLGIVWEFAGWTWPWSAGVITFLALVWGGAVMWRRFRADAHERNQKIDDHSSSSKPLIATLVIAGLTIIVGLVSGILWES